MELAITIGIGIAISVIILVIRSSMAGAKANSMNNEIENSIKLRGFDATLHRYGLVPLEEIAQETKLSNKDLKQLIKVEDFIKEGNAKLQKKEDPNITKDDIVIYVSMINGKAEYMWAHPKPKEQRAYAIKEEMRKKEAEAEAQAQAAAEKAKADAEEARIQAIVDERIKNLK